MQGSGLSSISLKWNTQGKNSDVNRLTFAFVQVPVCMDAKSCKHIVTNYYNGCQNRVIHDLIHMFPYEFQPSFKNDTESGLSESCNSIYYTLQCIAINRKSVLFLFLCV